jgi:hypothetical protein
MNTHKLVTLGLLAAASSLALAACGDDEPNPTQTTDAGVLDANDGDGSGTPDTVTPPEDVVPEETSPDVSPDVPDASPEDGGGELDAAPGICSGSISCFDERTGSPSIAVCRNEGYPDGTLCVVGDDDEACCVPPFACETDQDCEDNRVEEGFCTDDRFPCVCVEGGLCVTDLCSSSSECDEGEVCSGGICGDPAVGLDRTARILNRTEIVSPGTTFQLMGVAVSTEDARQTDPLATITFEADGDNLTINAAGIATAGSEAGVTTVTATIADGDSGDTVTVVNVGADTSALRVIMIDEATRLPITNGGVQVDLAAGGSSFAEATGDWVIDTEVEDSFDAVHVSAPGYATVSVVGSDAMTMVIPLPPTQSAQIDEVRDGFVCNDEEPGVTLAETDACGDTAQPPCLCYELQNVDAVRGNPDFVNVPGGGELDVAVSGFSLGNSLLDLNFDLIVGPEVTRIPPEDSPIPLEDEIGIPSGVSLYYNNSPFVDSFIATAPAGERLVWTIGGRVFLSDVLVEILPSLGGDLAFGPIIASILPLFEDFYSGISAPLTLSSEGTFPVQNPDVVLEVPTQRRVAIDAPTLPRIGEGWADTGIFLGGALLPGEGFVPMGITGGTDVLGAAAPDGELDGNQGTPAVDPINISMSPIHGTIDTAWTEYMFALVALQLDDNAAGPREATSGRLVRLERGAALPTTLVTDSDVFPPLYLDATWTGDEVRTLTFDQEDARPDLFRVVFQGDGGQLWIVYTDGGSSGFTLPTYPGGEGSTDPSLRGRVNVVALDLLSDSGLDLDGLLDANAQNLTELFEYIDGFSIAGL